MMAEKNLPRDVVALVILHGILSNPYAAEQLTKSTLDPKDKHNYWVGAAFRMADLFVAQNEIKNYKGDTK